MGKIGAAIHAIHKGWVGGHPPAVTTPPVDAAPYVGRLDTPSGHTVHSRKVGIVGDLVRFSVRRMRKFSSVNRYCMRGNQSALP